MQITCYSVNFLRGLMTVSSLHIAYFRLRLFELDVYSLK